MNNRIPLKEEAFQGENLCRLYDEHAKSYMIPVYRHFARTIANLNLIGSRVLDIGTGSGLLAIEIAKILKSDFHITAIDISENMLQIAQDNVKKAGLSRRIDLKVSSASALQFPEHSFDLIVSNASLHHWTNPLAAFNEIERVSTKGGFFLIRDNMRLLPVLIPFMTCISHFKGMNDFQRNLWINAIKAGYTISELNNLLKISNLKNYKVSIYPTFWDLNICCLQ
jgi:ubiquinone/menaquinone biosynthesis C-methylase UbiE